MADGGLAVTIQFQQPQLNNLISQFKGADVHTPTQDEINSTLLQIEAYGKQLAPVDTGRLRASILTGPLSEATAIGGMVSTNVDYAIYVELGTRKMRARPFLETAAALIIPYLEGNLSARLDKEFTQRFKTI